MIELKNLELHISKWKKQTVNIMFPLGIFYLDSSNKHIFDFLLFDKEQDNSSGQFLIDDIDLFSSKEETHFSLKINSKFGSFYSFFLVDIQTKDEQIKNIIDSFQSLKELPHETEEEINIKISKLFNLFFEKNSKYICVDFNEPTNKEHENIIIDNMTSNHERLTFICLKRKVKKEEIELKKEISSIDKEEDNTKIVKQEDDFINSSNEEVNNSSPSLNFSGVDENIEIVSNKTSSLLEFDQIIIGNDNLINSHSEEKKQKPNKLKKSINRFNHLVKLNLLVGVLISFACVLIILFSLLLIYSFNHSKLFDSILILLVTLISLSVCSFIQVSSFDFLNGKKIKENKEKFILTIVFVELSTLVGVLLGYGLFAIFYNSNFLLESESYKFIYSTLAIILTVVVFIIPFFAPLILKLAKKIKLFFSPIKNK